MPDTEISEECRALITIEFRPDLWAHANGNWRIPIDAEAWQRLQKVRLRGESISACIIRVIFIIQHSRGRL
jgi:hypothetical protein